MAVARANPKESLTQARARIPSRAANTAHQRKLLKYSAIASANNLGFIPLSFEISGHMHSETSSILRETIARYSKLKNAPFEAVWRFWISSIVIALQRNLANGIIQRALKIKGRQHTPSFETSDAVVYENKEITTLTFACIMTTNNLLQSRFPDLSIPSEEIIPSLSKQELAQVVLKLMKVIQSLFVAQENIIATVSTPSAEVQPSNASANDQEWQTPSKEMKKAAKKARKLAKKSANNDQQQQQQAQQEKIHLQQTHFPQLQQTHVLQHTHVLQLQPQLQPQLQLHLQIHQIHQIHQGLQQHQDPPQLQLQLQHQDPPQLQLQPQQQLPHLQIKCG